MADWEKAGCGETSTEDPGTQLLPLIALIGLLKSSWVWGCKVRNESPRATTVCPGHWSWPHTLDALQHRLVVPPACRASEDMPCLWYKVAVI